MIRRGTTPKHTFTLPFDAELIEKIRIIYAQDGEVIVVKENAECDFNGNIVSTSLTQEETLAFDSRKSVEVQIRVLTVGNDAMASDIMYVSAAEILEDEVLE